jgi:hypothetical protein
MIPDKIKCPNCDKKIYLQKISKDYTRFSCDCGVVGGKGESWGWLVDFVQGRNIIELGPENPNLKEALEEAKRRLKLLAFD